jgi:hypothetical protein
MTNSSVGDDPRLAPQTVRYDADGEPFEPLFPMPRNSRQMQSDVADMLRYAAANLKTPLAGQRSAVSDASLDEMHYERSGVDSAHIALGWGSLDLGGDRRWIISSGNDMGVQSSLTLLPEQGVGVIVLTNSSGYQADEIGMRIADRLAPGFLPEGLAALEALEARSRPYAPAPEWLGDWKGSIVGHDRRIPVTMSFDADGTISVAFDGGTMQPLEEATISFGLLTGAFEGLLPLEEAAEGPHRIEIGLRRNGDRLNGFALANFRSPRGKFQIPTYCMLTRVPARRK